jgi:hypothetical protein
MAARSKPVVTPAAAAPPPAEGDWGAQTAALLGVTPPPAPEAARTTAIYEVQRSDRKTLSVWWREQVEALEREFQDRRKVLARGGAHPCELHAAEVRKFGALGVPWDLVALVMGVSEGVLVQYYEDDYRTGEAMLVGSVAQNYFRIASSGNDKVAARAAESILNRRGGQPWRPPAQKLEIADSREKAPRVIDSTKLTWEQREQLRLIVQQHAGLLENGGVVSDAEEVTGGEESDNVDE